MWSYFQERGKREQILNASEWGRPKLSTCLSFGQAEGMAHEEQPASSQVTHQLQFKYSHQFLEYTAPKVGLDIT